MVIDDSKRLLSSDDDVEESFFDLIKVLNFNSNKNQEILKRQVSIFSTYIESYHKEEGDYIAQKVKKLIDF